MSFEEVFKSLPHTIIVSGKEYCFQSGYDANQYYAGYQSFGSYADDYVAWGPDLLTCLTDLLEYVIKRSWRAH